MVVKHVGVFGIQLTTQGTSNTLIGPGGLAWLFSDAAATVPRYFRECTVGLVQLSTEVRDGLRIGPGDAAGIVGHLNTDTDASRRTAIQSLCDHTKRFAGVGDLRRFDALVFFCTMSAVDGRAFQGLVSYEGEHIPAAVVSDRTTHSTICHEVGHAIGLDHSFQSGWSHPDPRYPYGEYGDPTDIMSAERWGDTPATFTLAHRPESDIDANAPLWTMAGPSIAPTATWRYLSGYVPPPPWVRLVSADGPPTEVMLRRPGSAAVDGATAVAAMPDSTGRGWWTVECRSADGWDRGLRHSPPVRKNSPGLVVHRVRDLGPYPAPDRNRLQVVDYIDTLPVPGGDHDYDNGQFAVRLVAGGQGSVRVLVGRSLPTGRSARLSLDSMETGTPDITPAGQEPVALTGDDCGTHVFTMERRRTAVRVTAEARSTGYTSPGFAFRVNGVGTAGLRSSFSSRTTGRVTFPAQVRVPTSRFDSMFQAREITAVWHVEGYRLWLDLPAGDGRYTVRIEVRTEEIGAGLSYTASDDVDVVTMSIQLPADAAEDIERCLRKLISEEVEPRLPPRRWPEPVGPIDGPDWAWLRGRDLLGAVRQLSVLESTHPRLAHDRRTEIATALRIHPGELDVIAARLRQRWPDDGTISAAPAPQSP